MEVFLRRHRPGVGGRDQQSRSPSPMGTVSRTDREVCGALRRTPHPAPGGNPVYREAEASGAAGAPAPWAPIFVGSGNPGQVETELRPLRQVPRPPPGLPVPQREVFEGLGTGWRQFPDPCGVARYPSHAVESAFGRDSFRGRDSWVALPGEDIAETWARLTAAEEARQMRDVWALQGARPRDAPTIQRGRWLREPQAEQERVAGSAAVGGPVAMASTAGRGPVSSRGHQGPQPHSVQPESRERLSSVMLITEDGKLLQLELPVDTVQAFERAASPIVRREDVAVRQRQEPFYSAPSPAREPVTTQRGDPECSPLEWDYSDLSGGVTPEDTEVAGLTGSVPGRATQACAREPVERVPVGQGPVRDVRSDGACRVVVTAGSDAPVQRPPCPFSPPMPGRVPARAESEPQDGTQSSYALPPPASRRVSVSAPVTTQATTRSVTAQVTWASAQPRVVTAVSASGRQAGYGTMPMQVGGAADGRTRQAVFPREDTVRGVPAGSGEACWGLPQHAVAASWAPPQYSNDIRYAGKPVYPGVVRSGPVYGRHFMPPEPGTTKPCPGAWERDSVPLSVDSVKSELPKEREASVRPAVSGHHKPEKFDGKSNWRDYRAQFNIVARLNGWDEAAKASFLASSLRGPALEVLGDLQEEDREDYPLLVAALEQRFGNRNQAELHKVQLKTRCKSKNETYQEMAQAIRRLTREAYPRTDASTHETLALDAFIEGISDDSIREKVLDRKPTDLESAVLLAVEYEARKRADTLRGKKHARVAKSEPAGVKESVETPPAESETKGSRRKKGGNSATVAVAQASQDDIVALRKEMAKLAELVAQNQRQRSSPPRGKPKGRPRSPRSGRGPCYNCQEMGHFAGECPYPRADKRPDGTPIPRAGGTAQQQGN